LSGGLIGADLASSPGLKLLPEGVSIDVMSATEILEELPKLNPVELETVFRRAMELRQGQTLEATPELLAAIDEADEEVAAEQEKQNPRPRRLSTLAERWAGKFQLPKPDPSDPRLTYLLERYFHNRS